MKDRRISAYLTTFDSARYPLAETLRSALTACAEVVVADGGSQDGTWEALLALAATDRRVRCLRFPVDRRRPDWALHADVELSAKARNACRGAYCLELEAGEVLAEDDAPRFESVLDEISAERPLLALPLLEYWDGTERIRRDLLPAAPRLSKNWPAITHGIPRPNRLQDPAGYAFARPCGNLSGSYIDALTGDSVPCKSLYPLELEDLRQAAAPQDFAAAFHAAIESCPVVHRFVWSDLEREVARTRDHWAPFHASLYRVRTRALPYFDKPWEDVSDGELASLARRLRAEGPQGLSGVMVDPLLPAHRPLPRQAAVSQLA